MGGFSEVSGAVDKVIVIAAGMGKRLRPYTDDRPKCMLQVGGTTILDHALTTLRAEGLSDIAIVRGYRAECVNPPEVTLFENTDYSNNNILHSLFYAEPFMKGGFVASYSDILYRGEVVRALLDCEADIAVVVDRDWRRIYDGRDLHPISEAEVVVDRDGVIVNIGKGGVTAEEATGEFIGLAKFSSEGAAIWRGEFARLKEEYRLKSDEPFQRAAAFKKAYLTDMFQELVDRGIRVAVVPIRGGWMEIDTSEDYERAQVFHA